MHALMVALPPKCEAPRKTWQGPRGTTNFINNSDTADTQSLLRMQRLRLIGIIGARANVLADLAWGEAA